MHPRSADNEATVRGRFAPSPTGPLHLGSLVTAVASYLHAKSSPEGKWLLRIEDIDELRCRDSYNAVILQTLEHFGLHWDEAPIYQSQRKALYEAYLNDPATQERLYACTCNRKRLRTLPMGYDGLCRDQQHPWQVQSTALRIRSACMNASFSDLLRGQQTGQVDDFIVRRKDGLFAYQLVVVIDDIEQNITQVVRGYDLMDSTAKQLSLYKLFDKKAPQWLHLPLVVSEDLRKLSKQYHAPAVRPDNAPLTLISVLDMLGQNPPDYLRGANVHEIIQWAIGHWNWKNIPCLDYYPGKSEH